MPSAVRGSTRPRIWTPPRRELTPDTSYGFDLVDFAAEVIGVPFDPWQEWLAIHMGELLPDGRPRFRQVLTLVARQQGKTMYAKVLTLFWMFVEQVPLVLGTSASRDYAKESWREVITMARGNAHLRVELGPKCVRETIGEECFTTLAGSRYRFAASNSRAGRSRTVHRLIVDELREHHTWAAWNAAYNAMNAVADAQAVAITNQGDDDSVVLDALRIAALEFIETGVGDARLGLFEWSAPQGSDPCDLSVLAMACPDLGNRTDPDALMGSAVRARAAGGLELAGFRTEVMCMRVALLDPAIDPDRWDACGVDDPIDLAEYRSQVALCLDVSLAGDHASLVAAAVVDGVTHVEVVEAWHGVGLGTVLRAELPGIVRTVRPRTIGWFPLGPAAAIAADMVRSRVRAWPPRRCAITELRADVVTAVCMGVALAVSDGEIRHPRDEMLTAHTRSAQKLRRGDGWVYTRRGAGPVDGAYALAGAVHLARTLPDAPPDLVVL